MFPALWTGGGERGMVLHEWLVSACMCMQLHLHKWHARVPAIHINGVFVHELASCSPK